MAAARVPKVALIVGPVGSITDVYRKLANEAAAEAQAAGAEVAKVYSPDATWPAVKRAVDGASIIVYLGHGNGWPSPYRNSLYPPTQNGLGLNPAAGGGDDRHQYFGERDVARLHPAANAVVLLSHLCYASGNSEPGLAEGSRDMAIQRVDNYAAGFLAAGAKAVVAEAALGPAYYVRALLRTRNSIEQIWKAAPTNSSRHSITLPSARTAGYTVRLDPRHANSGFTRSLVAKGVTAAALRNSATGTRGTTGVGTTGAGTTGVPAPPSLASAGVRFGTTTLRKLPIAGGTTRLTLPLASGRTTSLPAGTQVSLLWEPIVLDAPPAPAPSVAPAPSPTLEVTASPEPNPSSEPTVDPDAVARFGRPNASPVPPEPTPTAVPTPTPTPAPVAPAIELIVPEQPGSVVEPAKARRGARGLSLKATYPADPGLYRLTVTLHSPEGVVYDAATQAMLTPVLVRVSGPMAAAYGAPDTLAVGVDSTTPVAVKVLNAGTGRWDATLTVPSPNRMALGPDPSATPDPDATMRTLVRGANLVATWVSADGQAVPEALIAELPLGVSEPGGVADVMLQLRAPATPGTYLVLLDVVTQDNGPLSSLGTTPAIIRVTVNPLATPAPPAPSVPTPVGVDQSPVAAPADASPAAATPASTFVPAVPIAPGGGRE